MADKVATEAAKQAAKRVSPQVVKGAVGMVGSACAIAASIVQEVNNKQIVDLANKRYRKIFEYQQQKNPKTNELSKFTQRLTATQDCLDTVNDEIKQEEKAMSTFTNTNNDSNTKFIVGLGHTGNGKSTVMNRLYGDNSKYGDKGPYEADDCDQSVTTNPQHKTCTINNINCVLVDTPGYKDSQNRDDLHFNNLEAYLYGCGGVDAFLLVVNGTNMRFDGNFQSMLQEYENYFGAKFWKHLIIILTRIEGIEKKRFKKKNRGQTLQRNIKNTFNSINYDVPLITIGYNDDYSAFCRDVLNEVVKLSNANSKFVCSTIKSPIKKLKIKKQHLENKQINLQQQIHTKNQQIASLNNKINNIQYKTDNPESWPLFTNYSGNI